MDAERKKIVEETAKRVEEEYRLREAEKDKQLQDAMRANDELRRKLQQGSQRHCHVIGLVGGDLRP